MAELPKSAEIVVIGGGVVGCSVAYHLAKAGARDVVLLERDQIGSGTTWHSAGNLTWKPNIMADDLVLYAFELFRPLEQEAGVEIGWLETGRLFLARSPDWLALYEAMNGQAWLRGFEARLLTPREAAVVHPLLDPAAIVGAWHNPLSGRLSPANYTDAFARAARRNGATIIEGYPVTGIETAGGAITGITTPSGAIDCGAVVVCAGFWSKRVAEFAGISLAQGGNEHFYVIMDTGERLPRDLPSFICPENLIYGREEVGNFLFGCFDEDAKTLEAEDLPDQFAFSLLNDDWDKFLPYFEKAAELFPRLADAQARRFINGPETFTPDGAPLVGPVDAVPGLYVCSAMNSHGVTLAAGFGRAIADAMLETPRARFADLPFAPDRFGDKGGDLAWLQAAVSRAPSTSYAHYNQ